MSIKCYKESPCKSYVEFARGKITDLTTNIIAESMYTQYNADGNGYLLLNVLVDCCKDNKEIFLAEQQTRIHGRQVPCKTTAG